MIFRVLLIVFFALFSTAIFSQEKLSSEKQDPSKKYSFMFQLDSRRTIINSKSVGIYGIRLGVLFNERYEVGIGGYSTNLLGFLGSSVDKDYQDNSTSPATIFPSSTDFYYLSAYGEYRIINKEKIVLTLNSLFGMGRVNINFEDSVVQKDRMTRRKSLIEHSIKANVKTFDWLRLSGGIGYRYLINGEPQLKDSFNAPIYIIGFSINLKLFRDKIFL